MGIDNYLFPDALGAGSTNAVHGQGLDHGCADITGHAAQGAEGHYDQGQGQMIHLIPEFIPLGPVKTACCLHAGDREPAQHNGK